MATYAFKALDLAGAASKGEIEANDKQAVASQLRSRGLIVVDIEERRASAASQDILERFRGIKADDLVIATRQLSTMVQSGMSLLRALYVIEEQTESDKLRDVWIDLRKDVDAGLSLSDSLRKHPDVFNELYVAMVQAGESGGILDQTVALVAFLVPVFEKIFKDFGGELPAITKFTVFLSHMITGRWYVLIALTAGIVWVFRYWKRSDRGRIQWDRL